MLRGRLQLRNYLIIAYLGLTGGMLLGLDSPNEVKFILAVVFFIIGIIAHYQKTFVGYFISLFMNTVASGMLLVYITDYFEVYYDVIDVLIANGVLLIVFVGVTYSVSLKWKKNIMYYLSIPLLIGWLVFLLSNDIFDDTVTGVMTYSQYLGYSFMFVLYVTGVRSELILYRCSIATLIIFLLALLAGILIILAKADSDDIDLPEGLLSGSSSSSPYRYRGYRSRYYMWDLFFYDDACYFSGYGRRRDRYVQDNEEYFRKKEQKPEEIMPNQL